MIFNLIQIKNHIMLISLTKWTSKPENHTLHFISCLKIKCFPTFNIHRKDMEPSKNIYKPQYFTNPVHADWAELLLPKYITTVPDTMVCFKSIVCRNCSFSTIYYFNFFRGAGTLPGPKYLNFMTDVKLWTKLGRIGT